MNNTLLLIKNYYKIFITKLLKNKNKSFLLGFIAASTSILFTIMFAYISYTTIITSINAGIPTLALASFTTTLLMFSFMLIVTESSPTNKHSDENMLLSLPFNKKQIILAKIIYYLSFDLIIISALLLPSYIIYYVVVDGTSLLLVFRGIYIIVLATMFSTGTAGLISVFFTRVTKRFKHSNIIKSSLSVLLMLIFVIFYAFFAFISQDVEKAGSIYELYPIQLISGFVENGNLNSFIILSIICIGILAISVFVRSIYIGKSLNTYRAKKKELIYKEKSVKNSLFKRELTKYLSIPIYVSNTIFGPLFVILLAVIIMIIGKDYFINMLDAILSVGYESGTTPVLLLDNINKYFDIGLIVIFGLLLSTAPTTSSSISLEGKELWILKAHPVSYKDVFLSKIFVNIVVNIIPLIIASAFLLARIDIKTIIFIIIIPFLICSMSSMVGLYINLLYPKLEWESEMEVVKQGFAVVVTMIVDAIMIFIPISLLFLFPYSIIINLILLTFVYLILNIVWFIVLYTKGKKLYNKL